MLVSRREKRDFPRRGGASNTFSFCNCKLFSRERPGTTIASLPILMSQGRLLKVTRTTEVGFILHPVTHQQKGTSSTFLPVGQKQTPRRASGEMCPFLAEAGRESLRKSLPCGLL